MGRNVGRRAGRQAGRGGGGHTAMHFAMQPTSPGVHASMHFWTSDCEVCAGDSLVVEDTVWRVVGVVVLVSVVVWAVATASRPERRRVVKRILDIIPNSILVSSIKSLRR